MMSPSQAPSRQDLDPHFVLNDPAALKALADPLRMQIIVELSDAPRTVKEVASDLEVPQTRLYYHFKILERAGLIKVVETRMVSGIEERHYRSSAINWVPEMGAIGDLVGQGVIAAMLKVVRAELELALTTPSDIDLGEPEALVPALSFTRWHLSPAEAEELHKRMVALFEEFGLNDPSPERRAYHGLFTWYQAPDEIRNQGSDAS